MSQNNLHRATVLLATLMVSCQVSTNPDQKQGPAELTIDLSSMPGLLEVGYELRSGVETITAEVVPKGSTFSINRPELAGKTWQVYVILWSLNEDPNPLQPYKGASTYQGELTFDGRALVLPAPTPDDTSGWKHWFANKHDSPYGTVTVLRTRDPGRNFVTQVRLPKGVQVLLGSVDRAYAVMPNPQNLHILISDHRGLPEGPSEVIDIAFPDPVLSEPIEIHQWVYSAFSFLDLWIGPLGTELNDDSSWPVFDEFNWRMRVDENGDLRPLENW